MLAVGTTFGPYEVLAKLKAGGMATLFLARRVGAAGFRRHVAIKVVHEHLASDASFVRMFVDEALLQSRIHHPNVVHVEELGERDGRHFLVMEYVHGCSLAQLMTGLAKRDRRLTPEMACSIASQVLAGLHAAHELRDEGALLGVVHRDVSPQNVLLAYEGHVKLIDFGVAKAKNRQSTVGGSLKGKLRYMAPEQAFGRPVDRRCDVYALGIVLWEMLTMRRLFHAEEDLALLDLVRNPKVEPPSRFAPGIPPALDAAVLKALAPSPDDRFASAQDMRRALAEALPASMLVDASNLAELLAAVMHDAIEKDRVQLPMSVSAVMANVERRDAVAERGEEALKTMTISAAGLGYLLDEGESMSSGPGARSSATPAVVVSSAVTAPPSLALAPVSPAPFAEVSIATQAPSPQRAGSRSGVLIAAGAVGVAVVVALGVAFAMRSRGEGEGIVATPLAPTAAPAEQPAPVPVPVPVPVPEPEITAEPAPALVAEPAPEPEPAVVPSRAPAPAAAREERPRARPRSDHAPRRGPVPLADEF